MIIQKAHPSIYDAFCLLGMSKDFRYLDSILKNVVSISRSPNAIVSYGRRERIGEQYSRTIGRVDGIRRR